MSSDNNFPGQDMLVPEKSSIMYMAYVPLVIISNNGVAGNFQAEFCRIYVVSFNLILKVTETYLWLQQKCNASTYLMHKLKVWSHNIPSW